MNSKHKLKRIKWGTLIIISCLIGAIFLNASAKSLSNSKAKVKKLADKTTCKDQIKDSTFFDGDQKKGEGITITHNDDKPSEITINIKTKANDESKKANFWIFVATQYENKNTYLEESEFNGSFNKTYSITDTPKIDIFAVAVYKNGVDDTNCKGISKETAKSIAEIYFKNKDFAGAKNYYVAIGAGRVFEVSDDEAINENEITNEDLDSTDLSNENDTEENTKASGDYNNDKPTGNVKPKKVNDPSKTETIYCNKSTLYKEGTTYYTDDNKTVYYHEDSSTANNCTRTCKETVTVEYGPPVATKAGMCFEYKVKVSSKVTCKAEYNGKKPTRADYQVCTVYPKCNSSNKYGDQAGPDEDFDNCINTCDNGKYSQKCINKCYKEVYENTGNKKIAYDDIYENNNVKLLANENNPLTTFSPFCSNSYNNPRNAYGDSGVTNYDKLRNEMLNNTACKYKNTNTNNTEKATWDGGAIKWKCNGDDPKPELNQNSKNVEWKYLGRYYFLTEAKTTQTIQSIAKDCAGEVRGGGRTYKYYIDKNGFKRAKFSNGTTCQEKCEWKVDGNKGCYLNRSDMIKDYKKALKDYKEERDKCLALATCSNNQTTFYYISATDANGDEHPFSDTINNGKTAAPVIVDGAIRMTPIIASGGRCYGKKEENYDYMTEWGFPGSYISKKNGKVISYIPRNNIDAWYLKKGYYCTPFNSKGVNSDWYKWATYEKLLDKSRYHTAAYSGEKEKMKYNILAKTEKFGYFDWDINIKCFYATPTLKNTNTPSTPDDPDNPKFDYEPRSVDTKDMFPDSSRGQGDDKTIGFNWTSKAKENEGTDYEIQPDKLIANIQKQAKEGKTYSNDNLEYDVTLDRKALNALKDMKVGAFDNGTFKSKTVGIKGVKQYTVQFYRTDLLVTYGTSGNGRRRSDLCNNWDIRTGCRKDS